MRILPALCLLMILVLAPARAEELCISPAAMNLTSVDQRNLADSYRQAARALDHFPSLAAAIEDRSLEYCISSNTGNAHGYLDVDKKRIVINRSLPEPLQVGIILHEVRHLWQLGTGSCPKDELAIKEFARATFALEADASAISLLVAWDMKKKGEGSVWTALSKWPSQSDIAEKFEATMEETGDVELAVTAAFYQWYASQDRKDQYYLAACSDYLDRQDAGHFIPTYRHLDPRFFDDLCRLPSGDAYRCSDPDMAPNGDAPAP